MDIDVKGYKFTCFSNPKDGFVTREGIDRFVEIGNGEDHIQMQ